MARVIRFVESVIFMQGDSADEVLQIIYPDWEYGEVSIGTATQSSLRRAVEHLAQWDHGEPTDTGIVPFQGHCGACDDIFTTRHYVMTYSFSYGYVGLSRIVTLDEVRKCAPHLLKDQK